jgi:hypothetical protein
MEDRLRSYVDNLFVGVAPTKKAVELKEEMIQNLQDKYRDLISDGKTPEAAYNIAVVGIGDISVLLSELENETAPADDARFEAAQRRSAMFTAVAVMLYITSIAQWIMLSIFGIRYAERIGAVVFFAFIAGATGLLVFNNMTKPKRYKGSDTMVEEFRTWQSNTHQRKSLRKAISAALWTVLTALYFIVSFWTHAWHVTWIIFILGAAIEAIFNVFSALRK